MAVQVTPLAPGLPATTAIQDPAARQFANAVADILRTSQTADGAVAQLERAAGALSKGSGSAAPPAISQWLYSSELYQRLSGAIERVDTSAQEAIVSEALARAQAITAAQGALQTQINSINAELATISQTPAYDAAETYAAGDLVTYEGGLYRALQETTGNAPTSATHWEKVGDYASLGEAVAAHALQLADHETRVTIAEGAITAEAEARTLLATQVGANTAAIQAEAQARTTETGALSTQITTVVAQYQAADAAIEARFDVPGYDGAAIYAPGDPVLYDGAVYQALLLAQGVLPTDATYWTKLRDLTLNTKLLAEGVQAAAVRVEPHKTLMEEAFTSSFGTYMLGDINLSGGTRITSADALDLQKHFNGQVVRPYVDEFFLPTILANPTKYAVYFDQGLSAIAAERAARTAAVQTAVSTLADADGALAESITTVASAAGVNAAAIVTEAETRTTNDLAIVQALDTLWSISGASKALSQDGKNLITNWQTATAQEWQTLQAEVLDAGGNTLYAAVAAESQARADFEGKVAASWMVKAEVDVGTGKPYVAGIALGAEGQGGSATSEFLVRADRFAMVMPGYGEYVPFAVGPSGAEFTGLTSWGNVQGKTGFAALDGKITSGNVATYIDNAAIGNAQIGGDIWSSNFVAGSAGWRIYRSGSAEFRNVTVRGDVEASSLKANTAMVNRANIVNAAVDTLQIEGEAVTVPRSVYTEGSIAANQPIGTPTWHTVQSLYINANGSSVIAIAKCDMYTSVDSETGLATASMRILAPSGATVDTTSSTITRANSRLYAYHVLMCLGRSTEVGTYLVQVQHDQQGLAGASRRALVLIGTQR